MNGWLWGLWVALLLLLVFMPRYGLRQRWLRWRKAREREQMEDALKHLFDREQQGRRASPESLSGALGLSSAKVLPLVARMESQGLVQTRGTQLELTSEGERWALHVVRAHRLWERYLADEARMPLPEVHREAHRREHTLSESELDELEAALGHPLRDPHGDPIPRGDGRLPSDKVVPLTAWQVDRPARIVHLEDEPDLAYRQILAAGLHLGQKIRLLEVIPERYVLTDGENEYRLAPAVAANIFVEPLAEGEVLSVYAVPLAQLKPHQPAEIIAIDESVQGFTRRRFLDLGLTPGASISPELENFFGDPRAYRVRGTLIALRNEQAEKIWVRPL